MESRIFRLSNNKGLSTMLLDSIIIGGITFFASLPDVFTPDALWIPFKAFGVAFFSQLAFEKGIKRVKK